jgi:TRAP transporter TAXI family solute receptor
VKLLSLLAIVALASACTQVPEAAPQAPVVVRLATGAPGGGFYPFGVALADTFNKTLDNVRIQHQPSGGAVANLGAIQRGEADVAFAFADVAYLAYIGRLDSAQAPFDQMRAIAVLQLTPVQLVARAGSHIESVTDLRGRRVAMGPDGSGTALTARLIMDAFGVPSDQVRSEYLEFRTAGIRLMEGSLDAMFDNAFYAESAADALRSGARLVTIQGRPVDRLSRQYPFLRTTVVPQDTYPEVEATQTIGVDSLLICRRTLDPSVVHRLTAALFKALPSFSTAQRRFAELDQAPAAPIPLHEGAARYYREQELLR